MQVTREVINGVTHLVTDYVYENDNIGINLSLLETMKTKKILELSGVSIDYTPVPFFKTNDAIKVESHLEYVDDAVKFIAEVKYPKSNESHSIGIADMDLAFDLINTCLLEKRDIKTMDCYRYCFNHVIDKINETSLNKSVLIKTPELNYKCYIYDNNMSLLGIANRLLETPNGYVLAEYAGKKLTEYIDKNIFIDMCINNELTLQISGIKIIDALDSSVSYASISITNAMVRQLTENYTDINTVKSESFTAPIYSRSKDLNDYLKEINAINSKAVIEKYYKDNKPKINNSIDINKYLIW